jgi:hypothetical protein
LNLHMKEAAQQNIQPNISHTDTFSGDYALEVIRVHNSKTQATAASSGV